MNSIKLDMSKLLGFKILPTQTGPRGGPRGGLRGESAKLGSKVGRKVPPDTQSAA